MLSRLRRGRVDPRLRPVKLRAIDAAARANGFRSIVDLGGVWAVDGGYAMYAADVHHAERVVICDFEFTEAVNMRAAHDPRFELIEGDFTSRDTADRVGVTDAILMFDILLHQVAPDWDEVLALYAERTRCMVLAGPWWNGRETTRLLDLGRDAYLDLVPIRDFHEPIMDRLDEPHAERGRVWRDSPDIWQWGITEADLKARMAALGFELAYSENAGSWLGLERFDDCAYVFVDPTG